MKKEYIKPQFKTRAVTPTTILAGSGTVGVGNGQTNNQYAKPFNLSWDVDGEEY